MEIRELPILRKRYSQFGVWSLGFEVSVTLCVKTPNLKLQTPN